MDFTNPLNIILAVFYFAVVAALSFFSIFGVYALIRYGKNQAFSLIVSAVYAFFYLTILGASYRIFSNLVS